MTELACFDRRRRLLYPVGMKRTPAARPAFSVRPALPAALLLLLACLAAASPVAGQAQRAAQSCGLWIGPAPACAGTVAMVSVEPDEFGSLHAIVTFRPAWREALRRETTRLCNRRMSVRLDGRTLMSPTVREPIAGRVIALSPLTAREAARIRATALRPCPRGVR